MIEICKTQLNVQTDKLFPGQHDNQL